jgi:signal transduction histidine kinase
MHPDAAKPPLFLLLRLQLPTHSAEEPEDVTERRLMEAQLRQAQKLEGIGQLAAGIAHEINTPIQFVTDNLGFLRESWTAVAALLERCREAINSEQVSLISEMKIVFERAEADYDLGFRLVEVPKSIDQSLDGANRVAQIVRAMREFSHPDTPEKVQINLNNAIRSTITVARNEWKYCAEIVADLDENLPLVVCHPGDINQVILNLIVNAAHAISDKARDGQRGRITISTRLANEMVEIAIADTGAGIPDEIRTRVFEPFFTTKAVGKGTGQGLALAHGIVVKKHHGKIWFQTETGLGTTFFVQIPYDSQSLEKDENA